MNAEGDFFTPHSVSGPFHEDVHIVLCDFDTVKLIIQTV